MENNTPLILYIEDNDDNRKLVGRVLNAAGYHVHGVPDGYAGFDFVAQRTPDLILVDIQLPHIDGYTVIEELRKRQQLNTVPIIALTANVMKNDQERSYKAGCNGFIQKPVDVDLLPAQIMAYLAK